MTQEEEDDKGEGEANAADGSGGSSKVTVRHGWQPKLPVFSAEWEQTIEGAKMSKKTELLTPCLA